MKERGQALLESLPLIPLLILFLCSVILFTQMFLIRQKLLIAARFGAFLYSAGRSTAAETERQMRSYLTQPPLALAQNRLQVEVGRLQQNRQARLFELDQVRVRYQPGYALSRWFHIPFEERCVIKHAAHYGPPYQTQYGPAIPW